MNDIKNLLSHNGLLDKVIDKMIVKNVDDSKLDGIVFKYLDKNVYQITNDVVFKQCSKCKNFKEINQFPKLSKSSNCLFNKNYFCSACIKESRPKEKEHQYYLTRCKKQNPNYVPLSERMTLKKKKELQKAEKEKAKIDAENKAKADALALAKKIEIVEVKQEPIDIKEVNKVVPVKDIPVEIKLENKKRRKSKKSDLYTPITIKPSCEVVKSEASVMNQKIENPVLNQNIQNVSNVSEPVPESNKHLKGKKREKA